MMKISPADVEGRRRRKMRFHTLAALLLLAGGPAVAQTADGPLLAGACAGCHGVTGEGGHGIPNIYHMHDRQQFVELMRAFRTNERPNTVMGRIARGYTDAEISALAAHFARAQ
jgi:sulfide dehydrogenase cytochrome subunit